MRESNIMPSALDTARWRKSTFSSGGGAQCVELACVDGDSAVRDSKAPSAGALVFSGRAFGAFLTGVKAESTK